MPTLAHSNLFASSVDTGPERGWLHNMRNEIKIVTVPTQIPGYPCTYLPATFHNCPHSAKAKMCSMTFSLVELGHPSGRMTLVTLPALLGHIWLPSSLMLRIFPLKAEEAGNGYFLRKRNLSEGCGRAHRIKVSSRHLVEELTGHGCWSVLVLPSRSNSLERKSSWLSLGICPSLRVPW